MDSTMLLSAVAVAFIHLLFAMVILHDGRLDALWMAMYLAAALFYAALYFHRLHALRPGLRRRLRNAAVALAAFLSSSFFYNFTAGLSWWTAVAVWLGTATAAYLLYDVIALDQEEEAARLPV